mmetsp:Transcript_49792/g.113093  ORF Transcript_49792/g.113093 Transcript_49792/m.113093 type:complete len:371 (+) Transcript_49792:718-1830(+)
MASAGVLGCSLAAEPAFADRSQLHEQIPFSVAKDYMLLIFVEAPPIRFPSQTHFLLVLRFLSQTLLLLSLRFRNQPLFLLSLGFLCLQLLLDSLSQSFPPFVRPFRGFGSVLLTFCFTKRFPIIAEKQFGNHGHKQFFDGVVGSSGCTALISNHLLDALLVARVGRLCGHDIHHDCISGFDESRPNQLVLCVFHEGQIYRHLFRACCEHLEHRPQPLEVDRVLGHIVVDHTHHPANVCKHAPKSIDPILTTGRQPVKLVVAHEANPHVHVTSVQRMDTAILLQSPDKLLHRIPPAPADEMCCVADGGWKRLCNRGAKRHACFAIPGAGDHGSMSKQIDSLVKSRFRGAPEKSSQINKSGGFVVLIAEKLL